MTLPNVDPISGTATVVFFCAAVFERVRNMSRSKKKQERTDAENALISDAKMFQQRSELLAKLAEDNLKLYQDEHTDHKKTRDYWHDKASEFQATLSKCQAQIEEYKARPDLTSIVVHLEKQAAMQTEILTGIREVLELIRRVLPAV